MPRQPGPCWQLHACTSQLQPSLLGERTSGQRSLALLAGGCSVSYGVARAFPAPQPQAAEVPNPEPAGVGPWEEWGPERPLLKVGVWV